MKMIVAADKKWGIGRDNKLLVSIPADMKSFRAATTGQVIVMGRKTLESFPGGKPLKKTKRVFDSSKVTDHHAIIPTGVIPQNLSDAEQKVFDLIARRFIGVFLPDCKFSTTTVLGKVDEVEFKVTGKEILDPGWRVVREDAKSKKEEGDDEKKDEDEERTLPTFVKGESGEHKPTLTEKWTTPPPYYNEASLLRAMETAGKFVEDETLRAAMMKSCELTGIWEKKLRDIEHQKYDAQQFINELKQQVTDIVRDVMSDSTNRRITITPEEAKKTKKGKTDK